MGISITINMDNIITTRGKEMIPRFIEHFLFALTFAIMIATPVIIILALIYNI
jgi:hypothetical protein